MDMSQIPLFAMLRGRLGYLSERQRLISENVANSDTPGYAPRDLKAFNFQAQIKAAQVMTPAVTQAGHMLPPNAKTGAAAGVKEIKTRDSETTLDGNSVVLEEEMMKMSEARMSYDAAIGFYQKSMNLLRMAARAPGR
ncbi:flagellar basal body rod protein FlgB [Phenylobacterium deserti]|nr:flagellar basal body rod protein FlgB [Phenylobacterium deserti]